ncbi:hypothetical protein A0J51_00133 [Gluconobacter japonicus]|nr:hypothetical protein A0J51_00133 [Gluconobacter japonicus]
MHDPDAVAVFIMPLVVFDGTRAGFSLGNTWPDPSYLKSITEPVGIIVPVCPQPVGLWQTVGKGRCPLIAADPTCRHEETWRSAIAGGHGMKLRLHATCGASNHATRIP